MSVALPTRPAPRRAPSRRADWARPTIGAVVVLLTALGTVLGARVLVHGVTGPTTDASVLLPVGASAPTAAADVTVTNVRSLIGLSHEDMGNMPMGGMNGMVSDSQALIQATVRVTNDTKRDLPYDPGQFRLRAGQTLARSFGGTLTTGTLRPGASIDGTVEYVVPRADVAMVLEVHSGDRVVAQFDAGRLERPPSTQHAH